MSANSAATAPPGRKKLARGKERSDAAPGHASKNRSSPEGAKESSWPVVRLGDIAKTTSGGTPRRDRPQFYDGNIPWVKSGELGDSVVYETEETITEEAIKSSNAKVFPKGTLCIALYGATVGKLGILGIDAATNQAVCAIFPPDELDTRYLYRFFESKRRELVEQGKGGAQPNISQGIIRDTKLPLPPLDEQRAIVAEIEKQFTRLDAGVSALRRVQTNLKRYRAAVLKAACEGKLVPTEAELQKSAGKAQKGFESGEQLLKRLLAERRQKWRGRGKYKEPVAPDTSNLPPLPAGWTWLSIEAIGFVTKLAGFEYTKYVKYSPDGDLAVIKAENAGRSGFKRTEISRINSSTVSHLTRSQLKAGDLLMVFVGAGTGNVARVPDDQPYFLGPNIAMIRAESRNVSGAYLEMYLRSPVGHSLTFGFIKAVAQPSLSMGTIRMIPVALPPVAEQTRIAAEVERRLSVVEELETVVLADLQRATRVRQSILREAFQTSPATP